MKICISLTLTLITFLLSLYMFRAGRANALTFSYIGQANRIWFLVYSFTLALTFSLNIVIFTITNPIKNKTILRLIYVLLGLTIIFSLLQAIIIQPSFHEVHIFLAGAFTSFACFALITAIIAKLIFTKSKHGYYYLAMISITGGINFYAIYAYGWLIAAYQWLFATTMLATSCTLALVNNKQ